MRYAEYPPHPRLAAHVRCLWIMDDSAPTRPGRVERVVPDGCIEIIIHYADPFRSADDPAAAAQNCRALVAGQITRCLRLHPTGRIGMIGIRFNPDGAAAFLRLPMHELSDRVAPLEDFWGPCAAEIEERVAAAKTDIERVRVVQQALMHRADHARPANDPVLAACVRRAIDSGGTASVDELAAHAHLSSRQLERRFLSAVGLTPKFLSRIIRFRRVFEQVGHAGQIDWRRAALACGYYDQAHLIRDFRAFADRPPVAFFSQETGMARCLTQGAAAPAAD